MSDVRLAVIQDSPAGEVVRAFLTEHPEFVRGDGPLMDALGVKPAQANVVEFGPAALARATEAHRHEKSARARLEATARANFHAQSQVHQAVLELIEAQDHADLSSRLDALARARFGLAAAMIALEGPDEVPSSWHAMAKGQSDLVLGHGAQARLGVVPTAVGLFGALGPQIGSVALARICLGEAERQGVLAFGSADAEAFSAEMGRELIDFLARVVERMAERWPLS